MDQGPGEIRIASTDKRINDFLKSLDGPGEPFSRGFSQGEDFLLHLPRPIQVPSLSIHHDVRLDEPEPDYRDKIFKLIRDLAEQIPQVFQGLSYFFDPAEILRPPFFHLFRFSGDIYLFLLRLDLQWRPQEHEALHRDDNNYSPSYETRRLYLEADLIPLERVLVEQGEISGFQIRRSVSRTWMGETGRGYLSQGIWIDREITKFFSRLLLPREKRIYPYYPYTCKYRAVCRTVVEPEAEKRKVLVHRLHRARTFLEPRMGEIEEALGKTDFSEDLEAFIRLKDLVPPDWYQEWEGVGMRPFLNQWDMKEYSLEIPD